MTRLFSRNPYRLPCLLLIGMFLTTAGCKNSSSTVGESEEVLLHQAKKYLQDDKHQAAIEPLTHLSNNYQVSSNAQTYKLELMHAEYRAKEYTKAIQTADQYLRIYPFEAEVDYALYIKVLASLEEFNARHWMPKRIQERFSYTDTAILDEALVAADTLMVMHPKSRYAPETALMASRIKDILMKKSYHIAREYRQRRAYAASQRRLSDVIAHTESKELLHQSLLMMKENYQSMGQTDNVQTINDLLDLNWPKHKRSS